MRWGGGGGGNDVRIKSIGDGVSRGVPGLLYNLERKKGIHFSSKADLQEVTCL